MRTADRYGIADPLRAMRLSVAPHYVRRDKRDNEVLTSLIAALLDEGSNCLDVGAHGADVLREMCRCAPAGKHIAYEPLPELYLRLAADFPQVDVRCAALSTVPGNSSFVRVLDSPGYSGFHEQDYPRPMQTERIEVRVESIDESLPEGWIPRLIKIDVEGAERDVIAGGIETITRHRPIVVFEHFKGSAPYYDSAPADIYELLCRRAGLRIFDIDGGGPYTLDRLEHTFKEGLLWSFVAH
jgi:FkbM family methyltransferase